VVVVVVGGGGGMKAVLPVRDVVGDATFAALMGLFSWICIGGMMVCDVM